MIVLAFDPGATTGYGVWNYPYESVSFWQAPWQEVVDWTVEFTAACKTTGFDVRLVCEAFVITGQTLKKSRQMEPVEFIGVMRWLSQKHGYPLTLQTPAEAKRFSTDDKLKDVGWFLKGKVHANDAARHMMVYLLNKGLLNPTLFVHNESDVIQ